MKSPFPLLLLVSLLGSHLAGCGQTPTQKWNDVMAPPPDPAEEVLEIEVLGYQWEWIFRYPGKDGKLGKTGTAFFSEANPFGLDPADSNGKDDLFSPVLGLQKGVKTNLRIRSKDVLHAIYIPQFRVKMDAIPGMETHFSFTPKSTTEEILSESQSPDAKLELACAEICGRGHYSHRAPVEVFEKSNFKKWIEELASALK